MVGMPGQDRKPAVNLLQQHDSHKLMGPGCRTEGDDQFRAFAKGSAEPVRATDREAQGLRASTPDAKLCREGLACQIPAAPVERGDSGVLGDNAGERDRLLDDAAVGRARPALPNLDNFDGADTESAAGRGGAQAIAFRKLAFRPGLEPADRGNHDAHPMNSGSSADELERATFEDALRDRVS